MKNDLDLDSLLQTASSYPYAFMTAMLLSSQRNFKNKYSEEERAEMNRKREEERRESYRVTHIVQGICPDCEGKLTRGKKDKKRNYQRMWTCNKCGGIHYK